MLVRELISESDEQDLAMQMAKVRRLIDRGEHQWLRRVNPILMVDPSANLIKDGINIAIKRELPLSGSTDPRETVYADRLLVTWTGDNTLVWHAGAKTRDLLSWPASRPVISKRVLAEVLQEMGFPADLLSDRMFGISAYNTELTPRSGTTLYKGDRFSNHVVKTMMGIRKTMGLAR